jgi:hypothetical protein
MSLIPLIPKGPLVPGTLEVPDIELVLLAEFAEAPPMVEFVEPEGNRKERRAAATQEPKIRESHVRGVRLQRVIAPGWIVLAELNPMENKTPLGWAEGRGTLIFASARPGPTYAWQLLGARLAAEDTLLTTGVRPATPEESAALDILYPGWLVACEEHDRLERESKETEGPLGPPPPTSMLLH